MPIEAGPIEAGCSRHGLFFGGKTKRPMLPGIRRNRVL